MAHEMWYDLVRKVLLVVDVIDPGREIDNESR
jgi:hypothetical protein